MFQSIRGIVQDFRRYGKFSWSEIFHMLITSAIFGFILSFRKWGVGVEFSVSIGVYNWMLFFILSFIPILAMHFGHRLMAVHLGYVPKYKPWGIGLGFNLILTFISNGALWFLSPGGFENKPHEGLQLGKFRIGSVHRDKAYIAFFGLFTVLLYMIVVKALPLSVLTKTDAITTAFAIGLWSLFPLDLIFKIIKKDTPNSNGTILIFGSKAFLAFSLCFIGVSFITIAHSSKFLTDIISIIIAMFLAIIMYVLWIVFFDPKKLLAKK
jgi:hypothetical protein